MCVEYKPEDRPTAMEYSRYYFITLGLCLCSVCGCVVCMCVMYMCVVLRAVVGCISDQPAVRILSSKEARTLCIINYSWQRSVVLNMCCLQDDKHAVLA